MSSIDAEAAASRIKPSADRLFAPPSERLLAPPRRHGARLAGVIGGFLLTGIFLALSAAAFALTGVYGLIWFAQH